MLEYEQFWNGQQKQSNIISTGTPDPTLDIISRVSGYTDFENMLSKLTDDNSLEITIPLYIKKTTFFDEIKKRKYLLYASPEDKLFLKVK